ncbi:Cytochrome P450 2E1, variant 2 [Schistosoma haematobium]|uniref:Cytochrome P450 2E1, variant 2 n=1 Tax=Schistosoma haematobium TaxID=6185 RepID=A0A922ISJ2_SCHHA|nr:Cytochrome P450 2E1, variant 2 [Schistosoma haematobium]KAH9585194.1 Cytochrome P450 2E1, variant 2 [Schistosoma haematobium]
MLSIIIIYLLYIKSSTKLPPGPISWPLIGYISCLGTDAFRKIQQLNKIYGDIVSFQVLGKTIIILYNYDLINEAANENRSKVGRYTMTVNDLLAENSGISNYDTPKALEMRRALLRLIHNNIKTAEEHEGTKLHPIILQNIINAQINELIRQLRIRQGKPVNILHSQFARKLFDIEEILQKHKTVRQLIDSNVGDIYNSDSLLCQLINDSKLNLNKNDISRLSFELMAAGTDTTSLTLTWACDYLTRAPPKESFKLSSDVIDMIHRWASVVPLSLPHIARESFKLKNYYIPKSSILIYNLYAVHNSQLKKLINTEQKSDEIQESDKPIPFSLGSRSCPGARIATILIEQILTAINQEFLIQNITQSPFQTIRPGNQESLTPFGITRTPHKSMYIFVTKLNGSRRTSI